MVKTKTLEELRQQVDDSQQRAMRASRINLEMADRIRDVAFKTVDRAVSEMHKVASRHNRRSCGRRVSNG